MRVILEATGRRVRIRPVDSPPETERIEAELWQGSTISGIPCIAVVLLVTPDIPAEDDRQVAFEIEQDGVAHPRPGVHAFAKDLEL